MPVFISYSHQDMVFVEKLAANLISAKTVVWIDKWEINVGDSLLDKVQNAIVDSSAFIAVLSKASTQSEWCKKELNAALIKELEKRQVVVLPILMEDCDIPIFLRDKKYADFRTNFDEGLREVLTAIAKVTSTNMNRIEAPSWHTDWSLDWGEAEGKIILILTFAEHGVGKPYTVLTENHLVLNPVATERHQGYEKKGLGDWGRYVILECFRNAKGLRDLQVHLSNHLPKKVFFKVFDPKSGFGISCTTSCRRLGQDSGTDIIYHLGEQIWMSVDQIKATLPPLSLSDEENWAELILKKEEF